MDKENACKIREDAKQKGKCMKQETIFLKQSMIAHRGMHDIKSGIPENSIKAFEEAIKNNYIIELDVHILKDNSVVVFHDDSLFRMTGKNKQLKETTYDEIRNLRLQNTDSIIPLFKDVLKLVDGKVPIIIELKYDNKVGLLENEVVNILKKYKGKYAVKSFNPFSVLWFKRNYPNVIRGQLASDFKGEKMNIIRKAVLKNMLFNFITKPDFISYDVEALPSKRVEKYKGKKIILGWTIKNKEQMEKAKKYCDNFICENFKEI